MKPRLFLLVMCLMLALLPLGARPAAADEGAQGGPEAEGGRGRRAEFVRQTGPFLHIGARPFRFAGTNNYYLMYKPQPMVDAALDKAAASGFTVMRMWGSLDIGNQDGSNSIQGKADGVYFQYWDGAKPAYNDGDDGLRHLDYVIYRAGQQGLRLVIPFVNNWSAFGGMDQYVRWRGGLYHDEFYTDPQIRAWFKGWIAHLVNRTNSYTGVRYRDDPTIMLWELANEPRCKGSGVYPQSSACTTQTLTAWADEMSRFVKQQAPNQLVSVGDEGFYCVPGSTDWTENCNEGVDSLALARLPKVDVLSLHLYPDGWGKDAAWGTQWISRHIREGYRIGKPALLGEFGLADKSTRNPVYREWTDTVFRQGGAGALYWMLADTQENGTLYPDYDGFTVYCPSPVCTTLGNFARMMAGRPTLFPPVADVDTAVMPFGVATALNPPANDTAYAGARVEPGSIDLDPASAGQQTERAVAGGTFALRPDGTVSFTPIALFAGKASVSYTIRDSYRQTSNAAALTVTVLPDPTAPAKLFSFEDGTEGWALASWQDPALGSVAQTGAFATDGASGLRVTSASGAWFGLALGEPADLSGKTSLKIDLKTGAAGTSRSVALQLGDSYEWCQTDWGWVNQDTAATVEVDLTAGLSCASPDLSKVRAIYVWFSAGIFDIDYVRAE